MKTLKIVLRKFFLFCDLEKQHAPFFGTIAEDMPPPPASLLGILVFYFKSIYSFFFL